MAVSGGIPVLRDLEADKPRYSGCPRGCFSYLGYAEPVRDGAGSEP
jgi:hypothetical protein